MYSIIIITCIIIITSSLFIPSKFLKPIFSIYFIFFSWNSRISYILDLSAFSFIPFAIDLRFIDFLNISNLLSTLSVASWIFIIKPSSFLSTFYAFWKRVIPYNKLTAYSGVVRLLISIKSDKMRSSNLISNLLTPSNNKFKSSFNFRVH